MKICPKCEINHIMNDNDEFCTICNQTSAKNNKTDNNKLEMEKYLLPFLRSFNQSSIEKLTQKEFSHKFLKLNIPLLIKCKHIDKEHCKKEVQLGNSNVYRYYIEPYNINGTYYHICSQWWSFGNAQSKTYLQELKHLQEYLKK